MTGTHNVHQVVGKRLGADLIEKVYEESFSRYKTLFISAIGGCSLTLDHNESLALVLKLAFYISIKHNQTPLHRALNIFFTNISADRVEISKL